MTTPPHHSGPPQQPGMPPYRAGPQQLPGPPQHQLVPYYPPQRPAPLYPTVYAQFPAVAPPVVSPGMILSAAVADAVTRGWRVESRTEHQAVLVSGHRPNHVLHAILTLFLCGTWALVWIIVALTTREDRIVYTVDQYGQLHVAQWMG